MHRAGPGKTSSPGAGSAGSRAGGADVGSVGKRTLVESLAGASIQRKVARSDGSDDQSVHAAAARGVATPGSPLPFADQLQRLFGRHDISGVQAHVGADAAASAKAMGADAYATGGHVVLGDRRDLHTVAHEAAHVVQQRGGVQLLGGVGSVGDPYEQHADRVADAVVAGRSAEPLLDALPGGAQTHAVQRVGGPKFGIRPEASHGSPEGQDQLRAVYTAYHDQVQKEKERVIAEFQHADMSDEQKQTDYTRQLKATEMTIEELANRLRLNPDFATTKVAQGLEVRYKGTKIATILTADHAYQQVDDGHGEHAPIYKKHTLDGLSKQEYVKIHGQMLRRFAYRGLTPPERKDYQQGNPLTPINHGKPLTEALMGYSFDPKDGSPSPRVPEPDKGKIHDLTWLQKFGPNSLDAIPNDPKVLAFMQARRGTGRLFSATSTPRAITSNHGTPFDEFGSYQFDLAKVPEANVLHTYKDPGFDADQIASQLGKNWRPSDGLNATTERGNESILRNRELVISQIPNQAVTGLNDSEPRKSYEAAFKDLYTKEYKRIYAELLANADLPETSPAPGQFPMDPAHFGGEQARLDVLRARVKDAVVVDIRPRLEYAAAYRESYRARYQGGYIDAAEAAWYDDHSDYPPHIDVPTPDKPVVPPGVGDVQGRSDGARDGQVAGEAAGANHSFTAATEPTIIDDSADRHDDSEDDRGPTKTTRSKQRGKTGKGNSKKTLK